MINFFSLKISTQKYPGSFLVNFGQISKAIALLFGQKSSNFLALRFPLKNIQVYFGQFLANFQGYSLTFWPKIIKFFSLKISTKKYPGSFLVNFGQISKAMALLFGQK